MLGVNNRVMKCKRDGKRNKKDIKVTYISSPMKVKTSASNFRALVQELTGQDSIVAETFVEPSGAAKGSTQQWSEACVAEATWLKPAYHSRSSMEPLNGHLQYDLLGFDML